MNDLCDVMHSWLKSLASIVRTSWRVNWLTFSAVTCLSMADLIWSRMLSLLFCCCLLFSSVLAVEVIVLESEVYQAKVPHSDIRGSKSTKLPRNFRYTKSTLLSVYAKRKIEIVAVISVVGDKPARVSKLPFALLDRPCKLYVCPVVRVAKRQGLETIPATDARLNSIAT